MNADKREIGIERRVVVFKSGIVNGQSKRDGTLTEKAFSRPSYTSWLTRSKTTLYHFADPSILGGIKSEEF